jgi:L-glyceraldehyde 3-phosphate reductase
MSHVPAAGRYDAMTYRRSGRSGLLLPALSLGAWHNFGDATSPERRREILLTAFDLGITHVDLANNYGPPYGSAETNVGRILREDLSGHRDELIVSTKAGYDMWPGPYGTNGSRKSLLASLDQSLGRLGLDYVDIFYSHRIDAETPLDETMGALVTAVRSGRALYAGISNYPPERSAAAAAILRSEGVPLLIHQASYSLLNRWVEEQLLATLTEAGAGLITFLTLQQGLLTDKYLDGIPADARPNRLGGGSFRTDELLTPDALARVRGLNGIATARGQTLAQMAQAWVLRDARVTTALIGASSAAQVRENVAALANISFSADELGEIDRYAVPPGTSLWPRPGMGRLP